MRIKDIRINIGRYTLFDNQEGLCVVIQFEDGNFTNDSNEPVSAVSVEPKLDHEPYLRDTLLSCYDQDVFEGLRDLPKLIKHYWTTDKNKKILEEAIEKASDEELLSWIKIMCQERRIKRIKDCNEKIKDLQLVIKNLEGIDIIEQRSNYDKT